jgi:anthranilate phosphoribosyltransferase
MIDQDLQNLSSQEYKTIFDDIVDGKLDESRIKEFLLNLNQINFPANAFLGAIQSFRPRCKVVNAPQDTLDVCGTGGDGLNTLNVSTAVSFVVAACGVIVAKHGNKAISSKSGSSDVLVELGVDVLASNADIESSLKQHNLCFMFAPFHHPAFKNIARIRSELGVPTIFNFLGPLLNPANSKYQLIGTSKKETMLPMLQAMQASGSKKVFIIHGLDGMDEATISDNSIMYKLENGTISDLQTINPEDYGIKKVPRELIKGGTPAYNASKIISLLDGEESAYQHIVLLNSALALMVADKVQNIKSGIELAKKAINEGLVKQVFQQLTTSIIL